MRRAIALVGLGSIAAAACVDLFHDTSFTLPDPIDASLSDVTAPPDAAPDASGPIDFCALDAGVGVTLAKRACALLAACQTPFGRSATGRCLEAALPAMECRAAPGRAVVGSALLYYQCLAVARTCTDVERCISPSVVPGTCATDGGNVTRCLPGAEEHAVRVDCPKPGALAGSESCAAAGQVCTQQGTFLGACTGIGGLDGCKKTGCKDGRYLQRCADGGSDAGTRDDGHDCSLFGLGQCADTDAGPACVPSGPACADVAVTCLGNTVAKGCVAGHEEVIDCAIFGASCQTGSLDAGRLDVLRACAVKRDGGCEDKCGSSTQLSACSLGHIIDIDCPTLVGGPCVTVLTSEGSRGACQVGP